MSSPALYLKEAEELRQNQGQLAAYNSQGHCVVLAGPGSGKTKTLTIKIAQLLAEEIHEPRGIACITYNNECARELEKRLRSLGIEAGGRVFIGTVHSFSLTQIVLPYARSARLGLPEEFSVASRDERASALQRAYAQTIGGLPPQKLEFTMGSYRRAFLDRTKPEWRTQNLQLARLIEAYEQELRTIGRIDFDDMPLLAVRALRENPWLQRALLAKYPVLVVDEYQDLGRALHRMVMGLCFSTGMRLFAVGDTDQSIYGFTGAHPELLAQLAGREDVEAVSLRLNYRCGSRIVSASSYALGEQRDYEADEDNGEGRIYFYPCVGQYSQQAEQLFSEILPAIQKRLPDVPYNEIAILYQAAWIGNYIFETAQRHKLSIIRSDGNSLYPRSSRLMRWLEQCASWCCSGWKTGEPRFSGLMNEGIRLFNESVQTPNQILAFQRTLMAILWECRDNSLILKDWLENIKEKLLAELITDCRCLNDESEILAQFLELTAPTGLYCGMTLGQFSGQGEGSNCINLSTLHSAKGREFSVVIMFGMDNGCVPRSDSNQNQIAESRRSFYVGFTRAKSEVHIMYSTYKPSPFVKELQDKLEMEK